MLVHKGKIKIQKKKKKIDNNSIFLFKKLSRMMQKILSAKPTYNLPFTIEKNDISRNKTFLILLIHKVGA